MTRGTGFVARGGVLWSSVPWCLLEGPFWAGRLCTVLNRMRTGRALWPKFRAAFHSCVMWIRLRGLLGPKLDNLPLVPKERSASAREGGAGYPTPQGTVPAPCPHASVPRPEKQTCWGAGELAFPHWELLTGLRPGNRVESAVQGQGWSSASWARIAVIRAGVASVEPSPRPWPDSPGGLRELLHGRGPPPCLTPTRR